MYVEEGAAFVLELVEDVREGQTTRAGSRREASIVPSDVL